MSLDERLSRALSSRRERGMLRSLDGYPADVHKDLCDFSSNDYLSLSTSEELRDRLLSKLDSSEQIYGPSSSRLLDGNSDVHRNLESRLTSFFRAEAGLVFNSGFDANVGVWSCLPGPKDVIVHDGLIHASTHDGIRASRCKRRLTFAHNDAVALDRTLHDLTSGQEEEAKGLRRGDRNLFLAVEALYSMDGDLCPLVEIIDVLERSLPRGNGYLIVDEAHSTGLYGPNGRGLVCALGLANRCLVRLHTFGKAMACSGAVVLCTPLLRSYLVNYARPLIYSTVMPHINVHAISCAIDMLEEGRMDRTIKKLHDLAQHLVNSLEGLLTDSTVSLPPTLVKSLAPQPLEGSAVAVAPPVQILRTSPIVPILTVKPVHLSKHLVARGYLVRPLRYPTVPKGQERVRVCLHAGNTRKQVDGLVEALREWVQGERDDLERGKMPRAHL